MKYRMLALLGLFIAIQSEAQSDEKSKNNNQVFSVLNEVSSYPGFKNAIIAMHAVDLNSGEVIATFNSEKALKPGSTLKLLTTATALELLGPNYQFKTVLEYAGTIDTVQNVLDGDIYIKGGGDPTLGSSYFDSTRQGSFLNDWVQRIKSLGIDSINGSIIADASLYSYNTMPGTWTWENMGNYYGASANGISVFDNTYSIHFKTSSRMGDSARIMAVYPKIPWLKFENEVVADTILKDNVTIFGTPYSNSRRLSGSLPLNRNNFEVKGSIPDPAYLIAYILEEQLKKVGVHFSNTPNTQKEIFNKKDKILLERIPFYTTFSPPLSEIIAQTNINSINLLAEHCLIQTAIAQGIEADTEKAINALLDFWKQKGMDTQGLSMNDGSGLSNYNLITPEQLVFLLQYMKHKSRYYDIFYESLAVAGKTGTLKTLAIGTPAQGNLHGKSGTVDRARAFAGYVTSNSGREIAFSMVVNNFSCSPAEATKHLEKLMVALATFNK